MKLILVAFMSCLSLGFVAPECNNETLIDATIGCGKRYLQEQGLTTPRPATELEPEDTGLETHKIVCCALEYNKHCLPEVLKGKGCEAEMSQILLKSEKDIEALFKTLKCKYVCNSNSAASSIHPIWFVATMVSVTSMVQVATF
ncbi:uncharacterized protein LOC135370277 [Ornithodoros turicata]|uniref:uncharacterized protein LOC135370277 n=1 Tax=Ornithodoros turicata TaxID=34597 RepID=UPI00313A1498